MPVCLFVCLPACLSVLYLFLSLCLSRPETWQLSAWGLERLGEMCGKRGSWRGMAAGRWRIPIGVVFLLLLSSGQVSEAKTCPDTVNTYVPITRHYCIGLDTLVCSSSLLSLSLPPSVCSYLPFLSSSSPSRIGTMLQPPHNRKQIS
jgi:hypothetical protein